jgi:hypothetical protein
VTRIIVKAILTRADCIRYLREKIPDAEFCFDERKCAIDTFIRSLRMAGNDPAIHTEEDIILTRDFRAKAEAVIAERPNTVVQFFSMRKDDLRKGSRWDTDFLMNQCIYLPAGHSEALIRFHESWDGKRDGWDKNPDCVVRDFLRSRREPYWIHVPSLVEHRVMKSAIDSRRSSKRQSLTFRDPDL